MRAKERVGPYGCLKRKMSNSNSVLQKESYTSLLWTQFRIAGLANRTMMIA